MNAFRRLLSIAVAALLLSACGAPSQSTQVIPQPNGARPHHHLKRDASGCISIQDSTGATYTVAQVGGGSHLDVEYSALSCQVGIYISATDGPSSLKQTVVNGPFGIGVYLDNAGATLISQTSICVNGANSDGSCASGSSSSPGTGLYTRNTPNLSVNQTSIDGYVADLATNPCPNENNDIAINQSSATSSTYPWSFQGGKIKANHDTPTPPSGGNCSGSGIGPGAQTLFVGNTTSLIAYSPPFSSSSSPTLSITNGTTNAYGVAFDSAGNLYVSNDASPPTVAIYAPPFSNSSAPIATITNGLNGPGDLAFDPAGNLYVANPGDGLEQVLVYNPPFNNSSSPSVVISNGLAQPAHVAFDAAGNLYVANGVSATVTIFNPPFSDSSSPSVTITNGLNAPGEMAFDSAGNLYVPNVYSNSVEVYAPPFSNSSSPIMSITNGLNEPLYAALDSAGNLYVGNEGNNTIEVYAAPLSNSSSPIATITNGLTGVHGLRFASVGAPDFRRHPHEAKQN